MSSEAGRMWAAGERGRRVKALVTGIVLLGCFPAAAMIVSYWPGNAVSVCFFRTMTGYACPLCGLTRGFAAAWEGRWVDAWRAHPLWWLFALLWVVVGVVSIVDGVRGTDVLGGMRKRLPRWAVWTLAVLVVAVWLAR